MLAAESEASGSAAEQLRFFAKFYLEKFMYFVVHETTSHLPADIVVTIVQQPQKNSV
jgi:hypothetical protein